MTGGGGEDGVNGGPGPERPLVVGLDVRPALWGCSGIPRVARETAAALRRRDDVVLRPFGSSWRRPLPGHGVEGVVRRRIPARLQRWLARWGYDAPAALGGVDVFHHTDLTYAPVNAAPQVVTIHDVVFLHDRSWHEPGISEWLEGNVRRAAAAAAAVVVPSQRVADDVIAYGVAAPECVSVVPHGVDHVDSRPRDDDRARLRALMGQRGVTLGPADVVVLVPGTREPRKNQAAVLRAVLGLADRPGGADRPRVHPLLIGERGWGCPELEDWLREPAVRRRVAKAGRVDDETLFACMRACDLVAYASLAEGFGLPVAEAMACGRAVLTSTGTPMADYGGDAVVAVDPRDPHALAQGLAGLVDAPERRAALGVAARAAIAGLTWDRAAAALVDVYGSVAGRPAGPARQSGAA